MNIPYVFKKCDKCGEWLVANRMNFNKKKAQKYGIKDTCRKCLAIERKEKRTKGIDGKVFKFNQSVKFRHKAKVRKQVNKITVEEFKDMIKFFNYTDAYSGEPLTHGNFSVDHVIPLSKKGENVIWNLVPTTQNNNVNKGSNNIMPWYKQQEFYSEKRLQKIKEWQQYAFNKWGYKRFKIKKAQL